MKREDAFTIQADGITVTTGAASTAVAIPNAANGSRPYYIRVAATAESYIKVGMSTTVATNQSMLVQPADCVLLAVGGCTHLAYIQGNTAGRVNITPLEDQ